MQIDMDPDLAHLKEKHQRFIYSWKQKTYCDLGKRNIKGEIKVAGPPIIQVCYTTKQANIFYLVLSMNFITTAPFLWDVIRWHEWKYCKSWIFRRVYLGLPTPSPERHLWPSVSEMLGMNSHFFFRSLIRKKLLHYALCKFRWFFLNILMSTSRLLVGGHDSIPCRTTDLAPGWFEEMDE